MSKIILAINPWGICAIVIIAGALFSFLLGKWKRKLRNKDEAPMLLIPVVMLALQASILTYSYVFSFIFNNMESGLACIIFILLISFLSNLVFVKKGYQKDSILPFLKYKRKENDVNKFYDLAEQDCTVVETYEDEIQDYLIQFMCNGEMYLLIIYREVITDNQKLLLKYKDFKFVWNQECELIVELIEEEKKVS